MRLRIRKREGSSKGSVSTDDQKSIELHLEDLFSCEGLPLWCGKLFAACCAEERSAAPCGIVKRDKIERVRPPLKKAIEAVLDPKNAKVVRRGHFCNRSKCGVHTGRIAP